MSYELLTGQRPYRYQRARTALLQETLDRPAPPPASQLANTPAAAKALKGDLDAILAKALEREATQRYPTIAALVADLKRHLSGRPVQAVPDSLWYRLSKLTARDRLNEN
jgi:serine/threonine-protein kinase